MASPFVVFDTILNSMTTKFQINEGKDGQKNDHADNTHRHCKIKISILNSFFLLNKYIFNSDVSSIRLTNFGFSIL